jgi:hypothetical protein
MKYTVVWSTEAENELVRLWMLAGDRNALTRDVEAIEGLLQNRPQEQGESRTGDRRILICAPYGLVFRVCEADRIVRVLLFWRFTRAE